MFGITKDSYIHSHTEYVQYRQYMHMMNGANILRHIKSLILCYTNYKILYFMNTIPFYN